MNKDYFGPRDGLPTGPDVEALYRAFEHAKPGDRIAYADTEQLAGAEYGTRRWTTVTNRWRNRVQDSLGLVIDCEKGSGFLVLTPSEICGGTHETFARVRRVAKKQRGRLATIRNEDQSIRETVTHHMRLLAAMESDSKKSQMNILPETKARVAPRIEPPTKAAQ